MRILPATANLFVNSQNKNNTSNSISNSPTFGYLFNEDEFLKKIKKSKDFDEREKSLAAQLVALTKDEFNNAEPFKGSDVRYRLIKADKHDSDPRAHKDRIMLRVGYNGTDEMEGMFIDPCIREKELGFKIDDNELKELAAQLVEWAKKAYQKLCFFADNKDLLDDGPPRTEVEDTWIDWFPM